MTEQRIERRKADRQMRSREGAPDASAVNYYQPFYYTSGGLHYLGVKCEDGTIRSVEVT